MKTVSAAPISSNIKGNGEPIFVATNSERISKPNNEEFNNYQDGPES